MMTKERRPQARKTKEESPLSERNRQSAQARRGEITPKEVAQLVAKLKRATADFEQVIKACEALRIGEDEAFTMDGATKASRGLDLLDSAYTKMMRAVVKHSTDNLR